MAERPIRRRPFDGFRFAGNGLLWLWRTQPHMRVHAVAAAGVIAAGVLLASAAAAVVGLVIFLPRLWEFIGLNPL